MIIDRPDDVRVRTAGRSAVAPRLDDDRWRSMLDQINAGQRRCPPSRAATGRPPSRRGLHRVRGRGRAPRGGHGPRSVHRHRSLRVRPDRSGRRRSSATPVASATCISRTSDRTFSPGSMPRGSVSGRPSRPGSSARSGEGLVDLSAVLDALDAAHLRRVRDDRTGPGTRHRRSTRRCPPEPGRARPRQPWMNAGDVI